MNYEPLKALLPEHVYSEIPDIAEKYQICTPLRMAHFLSQCSHESLGFTKVEESLNYSSGRLLEIFSKYFDLGNVDDYARQPVLLASRVYANRMGNGPEDCCDGWYYRGRGYLQLTGRDNYTHFDAGVVDNIIDHPELVATKYPLLSAAWFWSVNRLNTLADKGAGAETVAAVTRAINGGFNGLAHRRELFQKYYEQIPH